MDRRSFFGWSWYEEGGAATNPHWTGSSGQGLLLAQICWLSHHLSVSSHKSLFQKDYRSSKWTAKPRGSDILKPQWLKRHENKLSRVQPAHPRSAKEENSLCDLSAGLSKLTTQFCPSTLWISLRNCLAQWIFEKVMQPCLETSGDGKSLQRVLIKQSYCPRCSKRAHQPRRSLPSCNFHSSVYLSLPGNIEDFRDNKLPLTVQQRGLTAIW